MYKLPKKCNAHATASARATAAISRADASMATSFTGTLVKAKPQLTRKTSEGPPELN